MKLWLIKRTDDVDYDQYDSGVYAADSESRARDICHFARPDHSTIQCIGEADPLIEEGWIVLSFNAG